LSFINDNNDWFTSFFLEMSKKCWPRFRVRNSTYCVFKNAQNYWVIKNDCGYYGNYVRQFMWQMFEYGTVDICMTFHKRAFDFFYTIVR
jgi:hypothetical protein